MAETAAVNIVIRAITEAAQQAIDEVSNELEQTAGSGRIAAEGLDEAGDQMSQATRRAVATSGVLQILQNRLDEVAGEARQAGRGMDEFGDETLESAGKAGIASGAFSTLSLNLGALTTSFRGLSTVIIAGVVPALALLSTTLVPLIGSIGGLVLALGGLAGAFGGVIGTGILAFGDRRAEQNQEQLDAINEQIARLEELQQSEEGLTEAQQAQLQTLEDRRDQLEETTSVTGALGQVLGELRDEILPIIAAFGEQFIPLIEDALAALPTLVENILAAVGPVEEFKQALRDFGAAAMEDIPELVAVFAQLARESLPALRDLLGWFSDNGGDIFSGMVGTMREIAPAFMEFTNAFIEALPAINEFGITLLNEIFPVLATMTGWLVDLINLTRRVQNWFSNLSDTARQGIFTAIAVAAAALLGPLGAIVAGVVALTHAFENTEVDLPLGDIREQLGRLLPAFAELGEHVIDFARIIGGILVQVLPTVIDTILSLWREIQPLIRAVKNLGRAISDAMPFLIEMARNALPVLVGIVGLAVDVIAALVNIVAGLIRWFNELPHAVKVGIFVALLTVIASLLGPVGALIALISAVAIVFQELSEWLAQQNIGEKIDAIVQGAIDAFNGLVNFVTTTLPQMILNGLITVLAVMDQWRNRFHNVFIDLFNLLSQTVTDGLEGIANLFIDGLNEVISKANDLISEIPAEIRGQLGIGQIETLQQVELSGQAPQLNRLETNLSELQQERREQVEVVGQMEVSGDGPLADAFRDMVDVKVGTKDRSDFRETQRQNANPDTR